MRFCLSGNLFFAGTKLHEEINVIVHVSSRTLELFEVCNLTRKIFNDEKEV
jgi:hypothetical protein